MSILINCFRRPCSRRPVQRVLLPLCLYRQLLQSHPMCDLRRVERALYPLGSNRNFPERPTEHDHTYSVGSRKAELLIQTSIEHGVHAFNTRFRGCRSGKH